MGVQRREELFAEVGSVCPTRSRSFRQPIQVCERERLKAVKEEWVWLKVGGAAVGPGGRVRFAAVSCGLVVSGMTRALVCDVALSCELSADDSRCRIVELGVREMAFSLDSRSSAVVSPTRDQAANPCQFGA